MIWLSPSRLSVLRDCPRCFWDANVSKVARPRGIFPSLPGGMDSVLKDYFDEFRQPANGLPPELVGKVEGVLFDDPVKLKAWRNWRSGLTYDGLGVHLIGALDDCLVNDKLYMPLDYKTKGWKPKTDGSEYYQAQLDCYALMLEANGYKTCGKGYLVYVWPQETTAGDSEGTIKFEFGVKVYMLEAKPDRAKVLLSTAVNILKGERPESAPDCEYCKFAKAYK